MLRAYYCSKTKNNLPRPARSAARTGATMDDVRQNAQPSEPSLPTVYVDTLSHTLPETLSALVLDVVQLGAWTWDATSDRLDADTRCRQICGLDLQSELRLEDFTQRVHPDDWPKVEAAIGDALSVEGNGRYQAEFRVLHRDGAMRWVLSRGQTFRDTRPAGVQTVMVGMLLDMTDRARAGSALRESEGRYRALAHMLTSVVWRSNAVGAFVDPQNEWEAYTGQLWEEHRGFGWIEALHPDDRAPIMANWEHALGSGGSYEVSGRIWCAAAGDYHHFVARAVPLHDGDGTISEWIGTVTDAHEQVMRERDAQFLADLAERIRLADDPDALPAAVVAHLGVHLDVARCYLAEVVPHAHQLQVRYEYHRGLPPLAGQYNISDYPAEVLQALASGQVLVVEDASENAAYAQAYEPYGLRARVVVPFLRDGAWVATLVVATDTPRCWQQREVTLLETVAERVWLAAEKLRAQQEIRRYARQLVALNSASVVIHAATTVGEVLHQITTQARELIGAHQAVTSVQIEAEQHQLQTAVSLSDKYAAWHNYTAPTKGAGIYEVVRRNAKPMRLTQTELEAHPAWRGFGSEAGKHPPMRGWLAVPLTAPDGQPIGLIQLSDKDEGEFTATDEAVLVQLAQLASVAVENARLYAAAQEAVQIRDQFLSLAAHELKTPLTALLGYCQTLLRRVEREASLGERDQRVLRQTFGQGVRLNRLIDALLDVGRIQMGRLSIEREHLDLSALLNRVADAVQATLEQHSLELVGVDEPVVIVGDELRLEQVVQNLLSNAVKYSPHGGRIQLELTQHPESVQIAVRDEGVGIAQDAIPQLFQRFFRVAGNNRHHISGMGIGLFVVKEIVSLHNGTVAVASSEGQGSVFTVSLPRV